VHKNLNKFKESAYGGSFRRDGRLLCAGGDEAVIKLFDVNTRSPLRIFSGHNNSVHRAFFTLDGIHIVSFSDDKTTALWDISNEKKVIAYEEHNDYIRAGSISPVSPNVYISGGYDKIVNMYDTRTSEKILSINHDAPVESVLFLPSGGVFLSAGKVIFLQIFKFLTLSKIDFTKK
jgi:U3 small nucleolar RNA-associated protein 15